MLQLTTKNSTTQFGTFGNGTAVRATVVACGMTLGKKMRLHPGKSLSQSCRPYCSDRSASREDSQEIMASARWQRMIRVNEPVLPVPVSASVVPPAAWAALVVNHAVTV